MLAQDHALLQITHLLIMSQSKSPGVLGRGQTARRGGGGLRNMRGVGGQFCSPPRGVPVPCICSCDTCLPSRFPACRACLITPCWEGPLGAVRLLLRPSWFTALPERRTRPGSMPSGTADAGTSIAQPTASALTYPSADASKVLHLQCHVTHNDDSNKFAFHDERGTCKTSLVPPMQSVVSG
jgi:hypothetical protein